MITFDLSTPAGRRACVLWHVGRGLMVKEAARRAGTTSKIVAGWRHRSPEFASQMDTAKRHGRAIALQAGKPLRAVDRRNELLDNIRGGTSVSQTLRVMGLGWGHVHAWRTYVAGFSAELDAAIAVQAASRSSLNPIVFDVVAGLRAGLALKTACRVIGIQPTMVYRWRYTGRPEWAMIEPHWRPYFGKRRPRSVAA